MSTRSGLPPRVDTFSRVAMTPLEALGHLPSWPVGPEIARRLAHGQRVPYTGGDSGTATVVATDGGGGLVAVGETSEGLFKPSKVFS